MHGDLHYDNLLLHNAAVYPIDFTGLRLAHYLYDIGVTIYPTYIRGRTFAARSWMDIRTFARCGKAICGRSKPL